MTKRIIAGLLTIGILGGLAYYSGSLYSEKALAEEQMHLKAPIAQPLKEELWACGEDLVQMEKEKSEWEEYRQEAAAEADAVQADTEKEVYYLMEEEGYVNIYLEDRKTLYDETEIIMEALPGELKEEVRRGKRLSGKGELYDFLENYSS